MRETSLDYKNSKVQQLISDIKRILDKFLDQPYELYVFGSFARGDARFNSDLDIALKTGKEVDRKTIAKIRAEIDELKTLRKIDFIYLNTASEDLKEVIQKEGVAV